MSQKKNSLCFKLIIFMCLYI